MDKHTEDWLLLDIQRKDFNCTVVFSGERAKSVTKEYV